VRLNGRLRGIVPPAAAFAFIALSFAGVVMVVTKGDFRAFLAGGVVGPSLMMLAGAVCWVVYTMGATYFPGWSPYKYTAVTTALSLSSMAVITGGIYATGAVPVPGLANVAAVWPELAYVALVAGFIGLLAWNVGIRLLGPVNGVLFMNVVPLAAFTISALTGVVAAPVQVAGAVVTAAGLVANNMLLRPRRVVNDKAGVGETC
jgi:drug/metabolite transporter (DMT)-like permease